MSLASVQPSGTLTIVRHSPESELARRLRDYTPRSLLGQKLVSALPLLPTEAALELLEQLRSVVVVESALSLRVLRGWGLFQSGLIPRQEVVVEDHGIVGRKVVTTIATLVIVDAFQNLSELENQKYHGLGTGSTAEAVGDTALVTELTTEYTGNVRATGTTEEGATGNIFKTVGTNTLDGTPGANLREHGIFSQAATGGGNLLDRTVYAALAPVSGDSIESTYQLTFTAGG